MRRSGNGGDKAHGASTIGMTPYSSLSMRDCDAQISKAWVSYGGGSEVDVRLGYMGPTMMMLVRAFALVLGINIVPHRG